MISDHTPKGSFRCIFLMPYLIRPYLIGCGPTAAGPRPPDAEYRRVLFGQLCKPPLAPKLCNPSKTVGFSRAVHFTASADRFLHRHPLLRAHRYGFRSL